MQTLFIGIGADEQLGGYSRHRRQFRLECCSLMLEYSLYLYMKLTACRSGGWEKLLDELDMDIKRLSQRNLGRDDR